MLFFHARATKAVSLESNSIGTTLGNILLLDAQHYHRHTGVPVLSPTKIKKADDTFSFILLCVYTLRWFCAENYYYWWIFNHDNVLNYLIVRMVYLKIGMYGQLSPLLAVSHNNRQRNKTTQNCNSTQEITTVLTGLLLAPGSQIITHAPF